MNFSTSDIKKLRDTTNAPMLECKNALTESNGNLEEAEKILKKKGLAALTSKEGRPTVEGAIFIKDKDGVVGVAEVKCETDFVANTKEFIDLGDKIVSKIISAPESDNLEADINSAIKEVALGLRENMTLGNTGVFITPENAVVSSYLHHDNKSAAVVCISGSEDKRVAEFARDCCLHLVAFTPKYITKAEVPETYIAEQKEIFKSQMDADSKLKGKPVNVLFGILTGKVNKHLAEICFEDQMFIRDDKKSVSTKLKELSKEVGAELKFEYAKLFVL